MNKTLRIAAIPGDGIGKEVLPEGVRVLQAAAERWGLALSFEHFEWASCDYYAQHGAMMPDDWRAQLQTFDAIYFGAVGGLAAEVPPRVRPVRQPASGAPVPRRPLPAGG